MAASEFVAHVANELRNHFWISSGAVCVFVTDFVLPFRQQNWQMSKLIIKSNQEYKYKNYM